MLSYLLSKSVESKRGSSAYTVKKRNPAVDITEPLLTCSMQTPHPTKPYPLKPNSKSRAFTKPFLTWLEVIIPFSEFSKLVVCIFLISFCHTVYYILVPCLNFYLTKYVIFLTRPCLHCGKDSLRVRILVYSSLDLLMCLILRKYFIIICRMEE